MDITYFSYGSNMSEARLAARIQGFRRLGVARLPGHDLRFHKVSKDGSAKCDAFFTDQSGHEVLGVLWQIAEGEKAKLDKIEGPGFGYNEAQVRVLLDGERVQAVTYLAVATHINGILLPYDWYLAHVIQGAEAAALPESYLQRLRTVKAQIDPDSARAAREQSIY